MSFDQSKGVRFPQRMKRELMSPLSATDSTVTVCGFQGQEVHIPASPAAGQGGVPPQLPDGGVAAAGPTDAHPHPAPPAGDGPQAPAGAASPGQLHRERRLRQRGGGRSSRGHGHPQEPGPQVVRTRLRVWPTTQEENPANKTDPIWGLFDEQTGSEKSFF